MSEARWRAQISLQTDLELSQIGFSGYLREDLREGLSLCFVHPGFQQLIL